MSTEFEGEEIYRYWMEPTEHEKGHEGIVEINGEKRPLQDVLREWVEDERTWRVEADDSGSGEAGARRSGRLILEPRRD